MAKMAVLVPYQEMCQDASLIFDQYPDMVRECVEYVQTSRVEERARELEARGCDIIMARGLQAEKIRRAVKLPVVEIRVTAQELGELILDIKAELERDCPRIDLFGFENMLCDTSSFNRLFGVCLTPHILDEEAETEFALRAAVQQAVRDGCQAVIGGKTVCTQAKELNLCCRFVASAYCGGQRPLVRS